MKFFISLVLTLFCACFVFGQEKELPQAEIQQLYIDYIKAEADKIRELSPEEMESIYLTIDSAVKMYQVRPNRGNCTLRKFNRFKNFPFRDVFDIKSRTSPLVDSERKAFVDAQRFSANLFCNIYFSTEILSEHNYKKLETAILGFEKRIYQGFLKEFKRSKNKDYDVLRVKNYLPYFTKSRLFTTSFISDSEFVAFGFEQRIKKLNSYPLPPHRDPLNYGEWLSFQERVLSKVFKGDDLPLNKRYARDLGITEEELAELKKTLNTKRGAYKRHGFTLHGNPKKKE